MDIETLKREHALMKAALRRIASYTPPDEIEEDAEGFTEWGTDLNSSIEMAFENVIYEAMGVLANVKKGLDADVQKKPEIP